MTTKKRSGLSHDRAFQLQTELKSRLLDIISESICFSSPHGTICDKVHERVFAEAERRRAPARVLAYLRGVYDTRLDDLYRYHLVWVMWVDGSLLTSAEMRALSDLELKLDTSKSPDYRSPWARCDSDKSVHVWKNSKGEILRDRPFFLKEQV